MNELTPILPGCEASYPQMLAFAQAQPLERKIHNAIALLQSYEAMALAVSPDGYYLAFSGGKDSIVIHELARMAGVRFAPWYNQTTIDPPELVRFIQSDYAHVRWNRPEENMIGYMVRHGKVPPTRMVRWCCDIYKEGGGNNSIIVTGVRAAESPRRKTNWKELTSFRREKKSGYILCPIIYWTDENVWEFIRNRGLKYPGLYDEGFKRLGCVGCPMAGPDGMAREFKRWPGFERLWKNGIKRLWETWRDIPRKDGGPRVFAKYKTWEDLWAWWTARDGWDHGYECQTRMEWGGDGEE